MQITRQTEYAIRTLLELGKLPAGEVMASKVIAEHQNIPDDFLKKTIQLLSLSSLVITQRGTQGGVKLARPLDQITIADVILAVEGPLAINPCLVPGYECSNPQPCPVRPILARAQEAFLRELNQETLAEILEQSP